jgi:starch phosphorylase
MTDQSSTLSPVPLTLTNELPEPIYRLEEVARNLWWSWSPEAREVFRMISLRLWRATDHNPVKMLRLVTPDRLERLSTDETFLRRYHALLKSFDAYMSRTGAPSSNGKSKTKASNPKVAYFSAEYGLHGSLPIYSGGLGILSGDHCKTASDLALDLTAVGFMYPKGYFEQEIAGDGAQIANYADVSIPDVAIERAFHEWGEPLTVSLPMENPEDLLHLQVWLVRCGRIKIYLMDSNMESNAPHNRDITTRLYGGDREYRLRQEIALGVGGVHVVRALGMKPDAWHLNEGHVAFLLLERLREAVKSGMSFEDAKNFVRASSIFTTHTPVPAGHDSFTPELIERYFWHFWPELGIGKEEFLALGMHEGSFNMTALSMNLSSRRNAVSVKHREVTEEMWPEFVTKSDSKKKNASLTSVTNGVHIRTWLAPEMEDLFYRELGKEWPEHLADEKFWRTVRDIPDDKFWHTRQRLKTSLFSFITDRTRRKWSGDGFDPRLFVPSGLLLDPSILTLGFARRFATYKRATLIFKDMERLKAMLHDPLRPIQLVFSGKAHPADGGGQQLIREIWQYASDPAFGGRIAFVENYSMHVAKYLVRGVDVWMNNPKAPLEASGTSGMKAAINGVPNFSVLDGWWIEGYSDNPRNGWGIDGETNGSQEDQDWADANRMYETLEQEIIPCFYDKQSDGIPHKWIEVAKESIASIVPKFSSERMLREYIDNLYKAV